MAVQPLFTYTLVGRMADISTADEIYFRVPSDGRLERVDSIISGAIATGDADLTVKQTGSATATLGVITVATSGSAAGTVDSLELNTAVKAGDLIEVETDGVSTNTEPVTIQLQFRKLTA